MSRAAAQASRLACFTLLWMIAAGCSGSVHKAGNDLLSNHYYSRDGYQIDSPYGVWLHKSGENKNTLTIGDGYRRRNLIDKDCDGSVDTLEVNDRTFFRHDPGAEPLFAEADATLARYRGWIHVDETHAHWKSMSVSELAKAAGN